MKRFSPLVLLLAALLVAEPGLAALQRFGSDWEGARWRVDASPGKCTLSQQIPRFGTARFSQQSGRRMIFSLLVSQPPVRDQSARIRSEAPPWKPDAEERDLGGFTLVKGKTPLRLPRDQAMRLYQELEQGMQPVIEFADWGDGRDPVQVRLSPVRFREALPAFLECTAGLLFLDFEPRAERRVFFATNSVRLNRRTRRILEQVAREYRQRGNFRIVLGGHADERGSDEYNLDLSRRRAALVARYLRSRGVPANRIETRYYGERRPDVAQSGPSAWARNRRVTVWIADLDISHRVP